MLISGMRSKQAEPSPSESQGRPKVSATGGRGLKRTSDRFSLPFIVGGASVLALSASSQVFGGPLPAMIASTFGGLVLVVAGLIAPRTLEKHVGSRLSALAALMRNARDGDYNPIADWRFQGDAFDDVAHLVSDLFEMQANIGDLQLQVQDADTLLRAVEEQLANMRDQDAGTSESQEELDEQFDELHSALGELKSVMERNQETVAQTLEGLDGTATTTDEQARDMLASGLAPLVEKIDSNTRTLATVEELTRHLTKGLDAALDKIGRLEQDPPNNLGAGAGGAELLASLAEPFESIKHSVADLRAALGSDVCEARKLIETSANRHEDALREVVATVRQGHVQHEQMLEQLSDDARTALGTQGQAIDGIGQVIRASTGELKADLSQLAGPREVTINTAAFTDLQNAMSDRFDALAERMNAIAGQLDAVATQTPAPVAEPSGLSEIMESLASIESMLSSSLEASDEPSVALTQPDVSGLPDFAASKEPFQAILTGFRVLVRQIGDQTVAYREAVEAMTGSINAPVDQTQGADEAAALSSSLSTLNETVMEMKSVLERLDAQQTASVPIEVSGLPDLSAERSTMTTMLAAFRMVLRNIEAEGTRLGNAVSALEPALSSAQGALAQPTQTVAFAQLDRSANSLDDLSQVFTRNFEGFSANLRANLDRWTDEATASLDRRLQLVTDQIQAPLRALSDQVSESRIVVEQLKEVVSAAQPSSDATSGSAAPEAPAFLTGQPPSAALAVNLMSAFAASIETRFAVVDGALAELNQKLETGESGAETALLGLTQHLRESADSMREQTGEFLAIGAAICEELESRPEDNLSPALAGSR